MTIEVPEAYFPETIAFEITETGTYDGEAGKGRLLRRVFFLTLGQAGLVISPFRAHMFCKNLPSLVQPYGGFIPLRRSWTQFQM